MEFLYLIDYNRKLKRVVLDVFQKVLPPFLHILIFGKYNNPFEAISVIGSATPLQGLINCRLQFCSIEVESPCKIVNIVKVLHPSCQLEALQNSVKLFCNSAFEGVGLDNRSFKVVKLCVNCSFFGTMMTAPTPNIHIKRYTNIFYFNNNMYTDTVQNLLQS